MAVRSPPAYEKSVFINCPFDPDYQDLMLAIVFSVVAHGFTPRSARETEGDPEPRFSRILGAIAGSKFSIHDLSRTTGEAATISRGSICPLNWGWRQRFVLSARVLADRTDGSPSYRMGLPNRDSFPI